LGLDAAGAGGRIGPNGGALLHEGGTLAEGGGHEVIHGSTAKQDSLRYMASAAATDAGTFSPYMFACVPPTLMPFLLSVTHLENVKLVLRTRPSCSTE
jgi:hypothetical protein